MDPKFADRGDGAERCECMVRAVRVVRDMRARAERGSSAKRGHVGVMRGLCGIMRGYDAGFGQYSGSGKTSDGYGLRTVLRTVRVAPPRKEDMRAP